MTCGLAVKRPHDFESYVLDDSDSPDEVEIKRRRQLSVMQPQCSPFRPQLGTLATSLLQSVAGNGASAPANSPQQSFVGTPRGGTGNFGVDLLSSKCQLSSAQLESYLKAEVQYLRRRRLIPRKGGASHGGNLSNSTSGADAASSYRSAAKSPSSCHSGSDSDGETCSSITKKDQPACSSDFDSANLYDRPQFSLNQVKLICERLLGEQALRLRYEYETALNKKLEEQHEQYVQFTREMIKEQSNAGSGECSYLS